MKKGNVIDFLTYREEQEKQEQRPSTTISEELKTAIQLLIYRLRELGPLSQSN